MPGKHANKEYKYAQNPYGPSNSYAGTSLINAKPGANPGDETQQQKSDEKKEIETAVKDKDAPKPDKKKKNKLEQWKDWSKTIQYV